MARNIVKSSIGVTLVLCIGYAVSFLKESVVANFFGVSANVDAYTIALQIPVVLLAFVAVALRSIVVPLYTDIKVNVGGEESREYINVLTTAIAVITLIFTGLIFIFAKYVIMLFAPGFSPDTNHEATNLLRIVSPTIVTTLVANVCISVLNVHGKYIWPAAAVLFLNTTVIIGILALHARFGIASAAIGQLFGCVFELTFLAILLKGELKLRPRFNLKNTYVRQSGKMALPIIWSTCVGELNVMINRMVASFLFIGSIAVLSYATKINSIFISLFTQAIATIIYPLYADSSARNDMQGLCVRINKTLSAYALFLIPLTCMILCLKKEIVAIAFERGAFNADAVERTQILLGWYSLGLIFMGFRESLTKVFYSLKDTKTPSVNATIGVCINIALNLTLPWLLGVSGLAIASSLTAATIACGLLVQLLKKYSELNIKGLKEDICRILPAAILAMVLTLGLLSLLSGHNKYVLTSAGLVGYMLCYIISLLVRPPRILLELKNRVGRK